MADFSTLYPRLRNEALGISTAMMDLKIRDAARQFMREVPAWRADHAVPVAVVSGTDEYPLTPPTDGEVVRVLYVDFERTDTDGSIALFPAAEVMLNRRYKQIDGSPRHFMTKKLNVLELLPVPDVTGDLIRIDMQIRPSRTAGTLDDDVLSRWEEEIMNGAQWLVYDMQDQPWTNKAEARRYKLRFVKSWADARRELDKGFNRTDLKVKIPDF